MPLFESRIGANQEIARDYFRMDFSWPAAVARPQPGQFFTIRVAESPAPLLRRPFGVSGYASAERVELQDPESGALAPDGESEAPDALASMIYWRRGPGTQLLAGLEPGDQLSVMGPLGVGFPDPQPGATPMLVAGGVGIGPILYLANSLAARSIPSLLVIGARTAAYLPRVAIDPRVTVHRATDDGSEGFEGTAVELLERLIVSSDGSPEIYLCGPNPMLRAGHECAGRHGAPAWVSMEQTMGCAVGACMGCAVRVHGEVQYARVCTEGPVFRSTEIVWE